MREWVDEISDYMQEREMSRLEDLENTDFLEPFKDLPPLIQLSEEIHQATLEAEMLLQASHEFQSAYSSILGKFEHANS